MPLAYSRERADAVIAGVAEGKSLRAICDELKFHAPSVRKWVTDNTESFGEHYARARDLQYEVWADEIKELADQCRVGEKVTTETDPKGKVVSISKVTGDMIERTRQQIDARKWLLSKLHHKRYGDKIDLNATHEVGDTLSAFLGKLRSGESDGPG